MGRSLVVAAIAVLIVWITALPVLAEGRVALIIGNSDYEHAPTLGNPANDTADFAAALERLGFEVERVSDQTYSDMRNSLRDFRSRASGSDIAVVYYAGHGIEVDNQNYLVPTDAVLQSDGEVEYESIPLDLVLRTVESARQLRLVIIDACRDNPFAAKMKRQGASRSIGRGLARVEPTGNTLVAFAAKEGTTAADGDGRNSPFATALLNHIEEPGLEIGLLFRKVRDSVLDQTSGEQEPFLYGSLSSAGVYLKEAAVSEADTGNSGDRPATQADKSSFDSAEIEITFWNTVKDSNDPNMLRTYLARYREGAFAELARIMIEKLEGGREVEVANVDPQAAPVPVKTGAARDLAKDLTLSVKIGEIDVGGSLRPAIGVQVSEIGPRMARALGLPAGTGSSVILVNSAGPADLAGIRPADVIVEFDGRRIENVSDLSQLSGEKPVGTSVAVKLKRYGQGLGELLSVLERAAVDGDVDAAWTLHHLYDKSYGALGDASQKFRWARAAGQGGDAEMQYAVSLAYQNGDGVGADDAEALNWARLAANQNYAGALGYVGLAYEYGRGVSQDMYEALNWFRKGAEAGDSYSIYSMGYAYGHGQSGLPQDHYEAMRWYRKAADLGRSDAQYQISIAYQNGQGVEQSHEQALEWARKAATQNHRTALAYVGYAYEQGYGVAQDMAEALKWYQKAADLENAYSEYKLGRFYEYGLGGLAEDLSQSFHWYKRSADHGDDDAQVKIGLAYSSGEGVAKDEAEALLWFRLAADQNNAEALRRIGFAYSNAEGVARDDAEALVWWRKAAELGDQYAEAAVGWAYRTGTGTAVDHTEAVKWLQRAVDQGEQSALNNLGAAYDNGEGVPQNPQKAADLIFRSIKSGNEFSLDQMRDNIAAWSVPFRRELQRLLQIEGLYTGPIDGKVGPGTTRALERLFDSG